ncbi:hypothetical protein PPL_04235 [Heterostelium album PN500]|uniref:Uncharacterized protein n=1 Tax=Heterostelium pallidum (strain ATCC 26659 / Pp 5 / PN500) TaxID=670386 RepID=D3B704_HETP5|nr:hypothetical protein PPL_04235 [Heterostelium album PN500]EFA82547.1 hypothetical protein PPL_04235 [Heterostelium album PN500]|eukprot:XP_020434664.1 hypothetical protein PPL_04235 [Heterostelium album PN500]
MTVVMFLDDHCRPFDQVANGFVRDAIKIIYTIFSKNIPEFNLDEVLNQSIETDLKIINDDPSLFEGVDKGVKLVIETLCGNDKYGEQLFKDGGTGTVTNYLIPQLDEMLYSLCDQNQVEVVYTFSDVSSLFMINSRISEFMDQMIQMDSDILKNANPLPSNNRRSIN